MPPLRRDRDVPELEREMRLAQFDIWAERNIQVLGSDADVRANDEFLVSYAESFLEAAANWFHAMPQAAKEEQLRLLGEWLASRVNYWKAEAEDHVDKLRSTEDSQAGASATALTTATWEDVTIWVLSDQMIQVTVKGRRLSPRNYTEVGLEDRRNGTPKLAWIELRTLAEVKGHLQTSENWAKTERRIAELRSALRRYFTNEGFDIPGDSEPIPFSPGKGRGYRTAFAIGTGPAYDG